MAKTEKGWRRPVAIGRNGKIRPHYAIVEDEPVHFPTSYYTLRHFEGTQTVRTPLRNRTATYAFDILIRQCDNVMLLPLAKRRSILTRALSPSDHSGLSQVSDKTAAQMHHQAFVRSRGIDRVIAKRADT
jgi:ATP-dependent DNA ligase